MNKMNLCYWLAALGMLSACSSNQLDETSSERQLIPIDEIYVPSFHSHAMISDYTERLANELVKNLGKQTLDSPVAIVAFVNHDATLQTTNSLGRILSENLISEMNEFGIPVLDLHLLEGFISNGSDEFVFSRDPDEFFHGNELKYVLTGVLVENARGVVVNARIMEFSTKKVLSTASVLIPPYVLEQ